MLSLPSSVPSILGAAGIGITRFGGLAPDIFAGVEDGGVGIGRMIVDGLTATGLTATNIGGAWGGNSDAASPPASLLRLKCVKESFPSVNGLSCMGLKGFKLS